MRCFATRQRLRENGTISGGCEARFNGSALMCGSLSIPFTFGTPVVPSGLYVLSTEYGDVCYSADGTRVGGNYVLRMYNYY